jgi:hypothetical protein
VSAENLKRCPVCGKQAGEVSENESSYFRFRINCRVCGWTTASVKLEGNPVSPSNEAKGKGKGKGKRQAPPDDATSGAQTRPAGPSPA